MGSSGVAVNAVVLTLEGERHVHPQRRRILIGEGLFLFHFKKRNGADLLGFRQRAYRVNEFLVILLCFSLVYAVHSADFLQNLALR